MLCLKKSVWEQVRLMMDIEIFLTLIVCCSKLSFKQAETAFYRRTELEISPAYKGRH